MACKLLLLQVLLPFTCFSQVNITGFVKDLQTNEPLAYCNVSVPGTSKGTITNSDGVFSIKSVLDKDVLVFSYLGYESKTMLVSDLQKNKYVFLQKNSYLLKEVEIHADNDYLYDIFSKSRKVLQKNRSVYASKAYYVIETKATPLEVYYPDTNSYSRQNPFPTINSYSLDEQQEKTVELLECFYNASLEGNKIKALKFRNGKSFLIPSENYFISLNSSKAIGQFCFFEKNEIFPSCPFQYGKNAMKKNFNLELLSFDSKNYHIKFYPRDNFNDNFSGDVWIEKESFQVLKINLSIDSAEIFPFEPRSHFDTIKYFNLKISNSYNSQNKFLPDYTAFDYGFKYISRYDTVVLESMYKNTMTNINSTGLIYYYDYGTPFIMPYFNYDLDFDDYFLISLFPYNKDFWETNQIVQLTDHQKDKFGIANNMNCRVNDFDNYTGTLSRHHCKSSVSEIGVDRFCFLFWSADKRVILSKPSIMDSVSKDVQQTPYPDQLYKIEVQILLDVTEVGDSIVCKSWTVFDTMKSFYKYDETELTRAFLNIYFDICEIERRKMQKQLDENRYTLSEIDSLYNSTKEEMEKITKQFVLQTDRGRDDRFIKKWNKYVLENLGIDNLELVKNTEKSKNQ